MFIVLGRNIINIGTRICNLLLWAGIKYGQEASDKVICLPQSFTRKKITILHRSMVKSPHPSPSPLVQKFYATKKETQRKQDNPVTSQEWCLNCEAKQCKVSTWRSIKLFTGTANIILFLSTCWCITHNKLACSKHMLMNIYSKTLFLVQANKLNIISTVTWFLKIQNMPSNFFNFTPATVQWLNVKIYTRDTRIISCFYKVLAYLRHWKSWRETPL